MTHDMTVQFRNYKKLLQLVLWRRHSGHHDESSSGGGALTPHHLVLKAPQIATCIHDFKRVFPGSKIVVTHRDPVRSLLSAYMTFEEVAKTLCARDENGTAVPCHENWFATLQRVVRELSRHRAIFPAPKTASLHYGLLMSDPVAAIHSVYTQLQLQCPSDMRGRVLRFLSAQRLPPQKLLEPLAGDFPATPIDRCNQRTRRRKPPPKMYPPLSHYGLTEQGILQDPTVRRYIMAFGLLPEPKRLIQPAIENNGRHGQKTSPTGGRTKPGKLAALESAAVGCTAHL